ncbi:cytochrome P450 [halophilic archaeon]|nr:cytochrome P450 [halophilic archaeon]
MESDIPDGPGGLPLVGNIVDLVRGQGDFYEAVAEEYGDVARITLPGIGEMFLLSDPAAIEQVLLGESEQYTKAAFSQDQLGELLGDGLVLSKGDHWQRQRQMIQPAFYRERIGEYADVMVRRTAELTDEWESGGTYDIEDEMKQLTLRILADAMFGTDIDYDEWEIRETVRALQEPGKPRKQPLAYVVPKWVPIPMWRRYKAGIAHIEDLIAELIDRRQHSDAGREDLLSMLLTARGEDGTGMSDEQIRDELITFLFAGHETTATALTFTWYLLGKHPDVERRLVAELDDVLGGDQPTMADLPDLTYTEDVIREAMRMYPPVPMIPRETTTNVELGGYQFPEGTVVVPAQWTVHHDETYYEEPWAFRPERWTDGFSDDVPRFAYFPFGGGPRRCIGEQFAMIEAQLVLATIAQQYSLDVEASDSLDLSVSITTRPMEDIRVTPHSR